MSNSITIKPESGIMTAEAYIAAKEAEEETDLQLYWWREMVDGRCCPSGITSFDRRDFKSL